MNPHFHAELSRLDSAELDRAAQMRHELPTRVSQRRFSRTPRMPQLRFARLRPAARQS